MSKRCVFHSARRLAILAFCAGGVLVFGNAASAFEVLGTGTDALVGNDLTDLGDDGDPEFDDGYDAIFDSSDEPGFGGGEFAFNVFDNRLGPSNDKWCCGVGGGISEDDPIWVSAQLPVPHFLTSFTISSANDVPNRDPIYFAVQGSNDGQNYTDIYTYEDDFGPWDERLQVIQFNGGGDDFDTPTVAYDHFRLATFDTLNNPDGAYFQVGEIEFFGTPNGVVPPIFVGGENTVGARNFSGDVSNKMFGPEMPGVDGWSVKLVDSDITIGDHTTAEIVLDDDDGEVSIGSYDVVDLGGGAGTFPATTEYPNGVTGTSMEDFAVRATAEVVIPVGTWSIGFGSDDGGQITIDGVEFDFDLSLNNDSFDDDQIRFEGNRGHGWTVGTFEVTGEPLATTITASMHERGGGDSFEIAVIEGEAVEAADPAFDWELLGNGTLGWEVVHTGIPLVSADLSAEVGSTRVWQFDVNGDTDTADQFVVDNPDPEVLTSILNIDGVTIEVKATGAVANGDSFKIIDADQIVGTPIITSVVEGQNWVFDATSGLVCLGSCAGGVAGDFNGNGMRDAEDIDLLSVAITNNDTDGKFDLNGDGSVNAADRTEWVEVLTNTYFGDSNFDGQFNSSDFVTVFGAAKYESGEAANWSEGDWNGDGLFNSSDFVTAFSGGGYEGGERDGGLQTVPEPSSLVALLLGAGMLLGRYRRSR